MEAPSDGTPALGLVASTEGLYRALWTVAVGYALATAIWGVVLAPFNSFDDHIARSVAIGVALLRSPLGP